MSITLVITYKDPQKPVEVVPVSTQIVFEQYWKPHSKALQLTLIPLFGSLLIYPNEIELLISELCTLKQSILTESPNIPDNIQAYVSERIDLVIECLVQLKPVWDDIDDIGV